MGESRIGSMRQKALVEGDENLLEQNEILVTEQEGYTILRERTETGDIKTSCSAILPLAPEM